MPTTPPFMIVTCAVDPSMGAGLTYDPRAMMVSE